jgi:hypothetical protein
MGQPSQLFFRNTIEYYYAIMTANGDEGKNVWATEYSWPTVDGMGVAPNPGWDYAGHIDEAQQASYIADSYSLAKEWGYVGVAFLWNLNFWPIRGAEDEMAKFCIVRGDWSPRPAYDAIKALPK